MLLFIQLIHVFIILWALIAPFSTNKTLLVSYVTIMPCIMIHWLINKDNTCFLSIIESKLRGVRQTESFIHRVVSPVYDIPDNLIGTLVWIYALITWCHAITKITVSDVTEVLF